MINTIHKSRNKNKPNLKIMSKFSCFSQKGVSIYLAVIIMSIILAMVLGMTTILTGQIKTIRGIENSVIAFYGADTGIERLLKERGESVSGEMIIGTEKKVEYTVERKEGGSVDWCSADKKYCIRSFGTYEQTKRAIKITE